MMMILILVDEEQEEEEGEMKKNIKKDKEGEELSMCLVLWGKKNIYMNFTQKEIESQISSITCCVDNL